MSTETKSKGKFIKFAIIDGTWLEADVLSVKRIKATTTNELDTFQITFVSEGHQYTEQIAHRMYEMLRSQGL